MAKKKTKNPIDAIEAMADQEAAGPHPDTRRLDALQAVLNKRHYTGKLVIRFHKMNKGLHIYETRDEFPQYDDIRDAFDEFLDIVEP